MTTRSARTVVVVILAVAVVLPAAAQIGPRIRVQPGAVKLQTVPTIRQIKGPERLQLLGKQVTLEGFYYDGSVPMLIDNFERTQLDMLLPPDSYVLLAGPRPRGVKSGDKIRIRGVLQQPGGQDPQYMQEELIILRTAGPTSATILQRATLAPVRRWPLLRVKPWVVGTLLLPRKYAVLIAGGYNPANNHSRYWNDLKTMYNILKSKGYTDENIYVIYANGVPRDSSMPVDYSATKAHISAVFDELAAKMKSTDSLYVMINDHGGGFLANSIGGYSPGIYSASIDTNGDEADSISESAYHRDFNGDGDTNDVLKVDETFLLWYDRITDDEFAAEVNKITKYSKMIFQMKQCFSGGFVRDLTAPKRIVMSSSAETQVSWSYTGGGFGEFTFYYFAALTGNKPDGSGTVNADANGNGKVSIVEAYNYARSHDARPETPWYEDNGTVPHHTGNMPSGGDGALGLATHL